MNIYIINWRNHSTKNLKKNTLYLEEDNWNDYGYKTTFHAFYGEIELGSLNIIYKNQIPSIPTSEKIHLLSKNIDSSLECLTEDFCSLGTEVYYEGLMQLKPDIRETILLFLNDCIYDRKKYEQFKNEEVFAKSLLRLDNWEIKKKKYNDILKNTVQHNSYSYTISAKKDFYSSLEIKLKTDIGNPVHSNIYALIGRNGVGKTQLLNSLYTGSFGNDINFFRFVDFDKINGCVTPDKIFINNDLCLPRNLKKAINTILPLITEESKNNTEILATYNYLNDLIDPDNIINQNTYISIKDISSSHFLDIIKRCLVRKDWCERFKRILIDLNTDPVFEYIDFGKEIEYEIELESNSAKNRIRKLEENFKKLSSGHKHIVLIFLHLVTILSEGSLVLIDEPEIHLHPPLLSSFIRALSTLLKERNALALIATHSPIILQEIQSTCVSILERDEDFISIRSPSQETFAENLAMLTYDIFRYELKKSGFHQLLQKQIDAGKNYEEILEIHKNKIGREGRSIILNLIAQKKVNQNKET